MPATWTLPRTWSTGELADASMMNTHIRDNFLALKTPPAGTATSTSNFTTTSTSATDVTWATLTVTTYGGGYDLHFRGAIGSSSAATVNFYIVIDGGTATEIARHTFSASEIKTIPIVYHGIALSAASHTIKIQAAVSAGTLTIYGSSGSAQPQYYLVERGA